MAYRPEFITKKSLLDGMFQYPGLLNRSAQAPASPAAAPAESPRSPGRLAAIADTLARVFGGGDDARLSPDANERARKEAMITAGLTTLASDRPGLGGLAEGALTGRAAGSQLREQQYGRDQRAQLQEMLSGVENVDVETLRKMFVNAIATGDPQAGLIGDVLKVIENRQMGAQGYNMTPRPLINDQGKPEMALIDPRSGKVQWLGYAPAPTATSGTGIAEQRAFTRENVLVDDYRTETRPIVDAYKFIDSALNRRVEAKAGDPAAQVGLLYAFVKAMDPNSVVREGEIALANAAAPLWGRAQALYADVVQGKSPAIPPGMIDQMTSYMEQMQREKETYLAEIYENYEDRARRAGVDPGAFRRIPAKYTTRPAASGAGVKPPWKQ